MRFKTLAIRNFLSFGEEQVIPLDHAGLVCVVGENRDSRNADSNGAGKSAIYEALVWALWGQMLRDLRGDDVVNRKYPAECRVVLDMADDSHTYQIVRQRKHTKGRKTADLQLFVDGAEVTAGTIADTQSQVDTIIGMDMRTFTQSVLLRAGSKSFCDMTDREQKGVLEDLLQIDALRKARDLVRGKVGFKQTELAAINERLDDLRDRRSSIITRLSQLRTSEAQHAALLKTQFLETVYRKTEINQRLEGEYGDGRTIQEIRQQATLIAKDLERAHNDFEQLNDNHVKASVTAAEELGRLQAKRAQLVEEDRAIRQQAAHMSQLAGTQCPTCFQPVDPTRVSIQLQRGDSKLSQVTSNLSDLESKIQGLEYDARNRQHTDHKSRKPIEDRIRELTLRTRLEHEKEIKRAAWLEQHVQWEAEATRLEQEAQNIRTRPNPYGPMVHQAETELADCDAEIKRTNYRQLSLSLEIKHLLFWDEGFSNQGLKSYLLDGVIPFLSERAQHYADLLSGGDLKIEFATQTQLKSGKWKDQFQVSVLNSQGADVYKGNSDGEKRRSDIAVGWALGDLAAQRARKPIRFKGLDEPFENLDEVGQDAVVKLLHSVLSEYETILCVTHNTGLRSQFPSELRVVKENGQSRVF